MDEAYVWCTIRRGKDGQEFIAEQASTLEELKQLNTQSLHNDQQYVFNNPVLALRRYSLHPAPEYRVKSLYDAKIYGVYTNIVDAKEVAIDLAKHDVNTKFIVEDEARFVVFEVELTIKTRKQY